MENAQESGSSTESSSSEDTQESQPSKWKCKQVTVVKTKEYKIPRHKKCTAYKICTLCLKNFPFQKNLDDHTSIDHDNYYFLCKHHRCGKSFVSETGLKRHQLQHGSMDYKCTVCNREFAFELELITHQTIHSDEKKFTRQYPRCNQKYKTKAKYQRHYKTHRPTSDDNRYLVFNKAFHKLKHLREHKQAHTDNLHFACSVCGDCFKWRSGRHNHM